MVKGIRKVLVSGFVAGLVLATALTAQAATTRPYAGASRYETADKILAEGWTSADVAILASGADANLPDALSVAPLAKKENAPLVFVEPNNDASLDAAVNKLVSLGVKKVYIATGTGVISSNAETKLAAKNIAVERLGGVNRYATALNIAKKFGTSNKVAVVSTENGIYADAVSIAPIAAVEGMPVLFTDGKTLTPEVKDYIANTLKPTTSYVVGGTGAVSDDVAKLLTNVTRFAGTDRYDTNFKAIDAFKADLKFGTVYATSGSVFADALAVSPYAAKTASPVVLVSSDLNAQVADLLKANMKKDGAIKIVGGTGAVATALEAKLQAVLDGAKPVETTVTATLVGVDNSLLGTSIVEVKLNVSDPENYNVTIKGQTAKYYASSKSFKIASDVYLEAKDVDVTKDVVVTSKNVTPPTTVTATLVGVDNSLLGTSIVEVKLNVNDPENYTVTIKGQAAKYYTSSKSFKIASDVYLEAKDVDVTKDVVVTSKNVTPTTNVTATLVGVDNSLLGTSIVEVKLSVSDPQNYNVTIKGQTAKFYTSSQSFKIASDTYLEAKDVDVTKDVVVSHK